MNSSNECSRCLQYIWSELPELEMKRFKRHLKSCRRCQIERLEYAQIARWVKNNWMTSRNELVRGTVRRFRRHSRLRAHYLPLLLRVQGVAMLIVVGTVLLTNHYHASLHGVAALAEVHIQEMRRDAGRVYHAASERGFYLT